MNREDESETKTAWVVPIPEDEDGDVTMKDDEETEEVNQAKLCSGFERHSGDDWYQHCVTRGQNEKRRRP